MTLLRSLGNGIIISKKTWDWFLSADGGELWMWGNAKDFQLGVPGLPEIQTSPVQVNFLTEEDELGPHKVISVSIGASHALCLVSRSH